MKNSHVFRSYLIYIIIFTLAPMLLISSLIYVLETHSLKEQSKSMEISAMRNQQNKIDLILRNIDSISIQQTMQYTVYKDVFIDFNKLLLPDLYRTLNTFSSSFALNDYIKSIYFYNAADQRLLTNNGIQHWENFDDTEWLDIYKNTIGVGNPEISIWLGPRYLNLLTNPYNAITLIRPFPIASDVKLGYVVINVDYHKLFGDFLAADALDRSYVVLTEDNQLIYSSDSTIASQTLDFNKTSLTVNHRKIFTFNIMSPYNHMKYIALVDKNKLYAPLKPLTITIYMIIFFGSFSLIALSFVASNRLYNPLHNLIKYITSFSPKADGDLADIKDEYTFIKDFFTKSASENKQYFDSYKNNIIPKLLRGEISTKDINLNNITGLHVEEYNVFSVITIENLIKNYKNAYDSLDYFCSTIENILKTLSADKFDIFAVRFESSLLSFIVFSKVGSYEIDNENMHNICSKLINGANKHNLAHISVGIGSSCNNIDDINLPFLESVSALKYRLLNIDEPITFFKDIETLNLNPTYAFPTDMESRFLTALKQNNVEIIENTIENIKRGILEKGINADQATNWILYIRDLIFSMPKSLGYSEQELFSEESGSLYDGFNLLNNIEVLRAYLINLAVKISEGLERSHKNKYTEIIDTIKQYLISNVNEDISLSNVADKFGISDSYLSTIFKQETGGNFKSYIISLKIVEAKRLLVETDMPVEKISEYIGYYNARGFYNIFKKYTGLTPSQYRNAKKL